MQKTIHSLRLRSMAIAVVMALFALSAIVAADESAITLQPLEGYTGAYHMLNPVAGEQPITLQTTFRIDAANQFDALWIGGVSATPDAPPTMLSLVWTQDTAGWFPVWSVQLHSDANLFSAGTATKRGSGIFSGSAYVSLNNVAPKADHVYQAELSYNPETGKVAVGMTDLTAGERLFVQSVQLAAIESDMYPAIGAAGSGITFQEFVVFETAVPLGTTWDVSVKEGDRYSRLALYRLTPSVELGLRLPADATAWTGKFVLSAEEGENVTTLFEVAGDPREAETLIPFTAGDLPMGEIVLRFDYVDEQGKVWRLGTRNLLNVAGTVQLTFGELSIVEEGFDVQLAVGSQDETLRDVLMRVYATVGGPDSKDGDRRLVFEQPWALISQTSTPISFTFPLDVEDRLFSLRFDVEFDVPVATVLSGNLYHVLIVE